VGEFLKDRPRIHRPDSSRFERLQDSLFLKGGHPSQLKDREEVSLID
jgi:hypothetical protein